MLIVLGERPHQSEITQLNEALTVEQNVAGLEVAMYHFPAVEVFQCKGNLIDYELLVYLLQDILPKSFTILT